MKKLSIIILLGFALLQSLMKIFMTDMRRLIFMVLRKVQMLH